MADNFGVYVKLKVDQSQDAKNRFQKEIETLAANVTPEIDLHIKQLTIKKIDTEPAVNQLRKDLEKMLSTLSVNNLGAILKDTKDSKSAGSFDNATKSASAYIQELKLLQAEIDKTYRKQVSGKSAVIDTAKLDAARAKYLELRTVIDQMTSGAVADTKEQQAALSKLIAEFNKLTGTAVTANTTQNKTHQNTVAKLSSILALQKQVTQYMKRNPLAAMDSNFGRQLNDILDQLSKATNLTNADLEKLKNTFLEIQLEADKTGKSGKSLIGTISAMYTKFGGLNLVHKSINAIVQGFKQMITCIIELDTAMTELKKVTDETDSRYQEFFEKAITRAKELGAAVTDVVTASADFARLGYSLDEASALADAAIVYKNVGDGIENISTASESIISTMKAFGIETAQAMTIVDRFNKIGNEFPISSKGVGDALVRSAAALAAAGNDLNESIALITAANSVVQDPEKVGTTIKTVSMFLRAAKTEAEEAGESTEGMANSVSELREELLALTGGKLDIQIDEDTYKSTFQILKELSQVWNELTDVTQANILEMVGGKRNSNVVAALLNNFEMAQEVMVSTANSAGSALAENDKYLESIAGHISVFKATFQELSSELIDSEMTKDIVDLGTGLLNILTIIGDITEAIGGWESVAGIGATLLGVQGIQSVTTLAQNKLPAVEQSVKKVWDSVTQLADAWKIVGKEGYQGISKITNALSLADFPISNATLGITGLVAAISTAVIIYNKYQQKVQEQALAAQQAAVAHNEQNALLDEYIDKVQTLRDELNRSNLTEQESYERRQELIKIQKALIDMYGDEAKGIDLVTGSLEQQIATLKTLPKTQWGRDLATNRAARNRAVELYTDFSHSSVDLFNRTIGSDGFTFRNLNNDDLLKGIQALGLNTTAEAIKQEYAEALQEAFPELQIPLTATGDFELEISSVDEAIDVLTQASQIASEIGEKYFKGQGEVYLDGVLGSYANRLQQLIEYETEYKTIFDDYAQGVLMYEEEYSDLYAKLLLAQTQYEEAILNGDTSAAATARQTMAEVTEQVETAIRNGEWTNEAAIYYIRQLFDDFNEQIQDQELVLDIATAIDTGEATDKFKAVQRELEHFKDKFGDISAEDIFEVGNKVEGYDASYEDYTEQEAAYLRLATAAQEYDITVSELINTLISYGIVQGSIPDIADSPFGSISTLAKDFAQIQKWIDLIADAKAELEKDGSISTETLSELQALAGDEYLDYITMAGDAMVMDIQAANVMVGTEIRKLTNDIEHDLEYYEDQLKDLTTQKHPLEDSGNRRAYICENGREAYDNQINLYDTQIAELEGKIKQHKTAVDMYGAALAQTTTATTAEALFYADNVLSALDRVEAEIQFINTAPVWAGATAEARNAALAELEAYKAVLERQLPTALAKQNFGEIWNSEEFKSTKESIEEMARSLEGITAENVTELAENCDALQALLKLDGMNAEYLANVLLMMGRGENGLDLITEESLALNDALNSMEEEFEAVTIAKAKYDAAMNVSEKDEGFRSYADAYAKLQEEIKAGTINSNAFWASAEYLFGTEWLDDIGWEEGLEQIKTRATDLAMVFGAAETAGAGLIIKLHEMSEAGKLLDETTGEALINIKKVGTGAYEFDFNTDNLTEIAERVGTTTEAITACFEAVQMFGDIDFFNADEVLSRILDIGLGIEKAGRTGVNLRGLTEQLKAFGKTGKEIHDITEALIELGSVDFVDAAQSTDELVQSLTNLGYITQADNVLTIDLQGMLTFMQDIGIFKEEVNTIISLLGETDNIRFQNLEGQIINIQDALAEVNKMDFIAAEDETAGLEESINDTEHAATDALKAIDDINDAKLDSVESEFSSLKNKADSLNRVLLRNRDRLREVNDLWKESPYYVPSSPEEPVAPVSGGVSESIEGHAKGTSGAKGGPSLIGEKAPELVWTGDEAYLAGINGPTVVDLNPGDVVYDGEETRKILGGRAGISGRIPAYSGGIGADASGGSIFPESTLDAIAEAVNVAANATEDIEDALKDILDELEDKLDASLGNTEHKIFLAEKNGTNPDEIIEMYKQMQDEVHVQAEAYREMGLEETSDYIEELQRKWWSYQDEIEAIQEEVAEEAQQAIEDAVEAIEEEVADIKFEIEAMERSGVDSDSIIYEYNSLLRKLRDKIRWLISQGETMASDSVQSLVKEIWEIEDAINDITKAAKEAALEARRETVETVSDAVYDRISDLLEAERESLEAELDRLDEELDTYREEQEAAAEAIRERNEAQIEALRAEKEERADIADEAAKLLAIEEAREALAKARSQKTKRIYVDGKGWVWEADQDAVMEAQQDLNEALDAYDTYEFEKKIDDQIEALEEETKAAEDACDRNIKAFEEAQKEIRADIEKQIKDLDRLEDAWQDAMDIDDDISGYADALSFIEDFERGSFERRLQLIREFSAQYKQEMAELEQATKELEEELQDNSSLEDLGGSDSSKGDDEYTIYLPADDENTGSHKLVMVQADGTAPSGLNVGDRVATHGGTYEITKVNRDGSYESKKIDNKETYGYQPGSVIDYFDNYDAVNKSDNQSGNQDTGYNEEDFVIYLPLDEDETNTSNENSSSNYDDDFTITLPSGGDNKLVMAQADGSAPPNLNVGDQVATHGGTYEIVKVYSDGTYKSKKIDNKSTYGYPAGAIIGYFDQGGVASSTGPAMLHGSYRSAEVIFNAEDAKKLYSLIHNTSDLSSLIVPEVIRSVEKQVQRVETTSETVLPSFNIGDIYLQGVQDVDGLAKAIKTRLPGRVLQEIFKR